MCINIFILQASWASKPGQKKIRDEECTDDERQNATGIIQPVSQPAGPAGPAQSIFFSERYFSMGIALRPENQYRSLSFTDAVSMLDKR